MNTELEGVSKAGEGVPEFDVVHGGFGLTVCDPSGFLTIAFVAIQPAGSAGGLTASKLSLKTVTHAVLVGLAVGVRVGVLVGGTGVLVAVFAGAPVGVGVAVRVGVGVGVGVAVGGGAVGVLVALGVGVRVGVEVAVAGTGVGVGDTEAPANLAR